MSDSLGSHGLEPSRLLCPWDSPGKNTGVDCHAIPQGNLPDLRIELGSLALQADFLLSGPPGKSSEKYFLKGGKKNWEREKCLVI